MNIVHVNNIANIASYLSKGQRSLNHSVRLLVRSDAAREWPGDLTLHTRGHPLSWNAEMLRHWRTFKQADIIHVHGGIWRCQLAYGILRKLSPRAALIVHLHGAETREGRGLHHLRWADAILCSTPDLPQYVPGARYIPNPLGFSLEPSPPNEEGKVVIGHFPSRRGMKGTGTITAAFKDLTGGSFDKESEDGITVFDSRDVTLRIVRGLRHADALEVMQQCDIVLDQMTPWGVYGLVSVEAMAMGKVVVSSLIPDYYHNLPIVGIHPRSISEEVLAETLQHLISKRDQWKKMGDVGQAYVAHHHSLSTITEEVLAVYDDALRRR